MCGKKLLCDVDVLFFMFKLSSFYYENTLENLKFHREITGKHTEFSFQKWEPCIKLEQNIKRKSWSQNIKQTLHLHFNGIKRIVGFINVLNPIIIWMQYFLAITNAFGLLTTLCALHVHVCHNLSALYFLIKWPAFFICTSYENIWK